MKKENLVKYLMQKHHCSKLETKENKDDVLMWGIATQFWKLFQAWCIYVFVHALKYFKQLNKTNVSQVQIKRDLNQML